MGIQTSAGSTVAVSATLPATETSGGYAALTFTPIGSISDAGTIEQTFAEVTFTALDDRIVQKFKGSKNPGSVTLQLGKNVSDAGQVILKAALASDNAYAFVTTLQDGTKLYYSGRVMSFSVQVGSTDQITGATVNIGVSTIPIEV